MGNGVTKPDGDSPEQHLFDTFVRKLQNRLDAEEGPSDSDLAFVRKFLVDLGIQDFRSDKAVGSLGASVEATPFPSVSAARKVS